MPDPKETRNEQHEKLQIVRALAEEGFRQLDQGKGIPIDSDADLFTLFDRIDRDAVADAKAMMLRRLAAEGIEQIDRGEGIHIDSYDELEALIARIGRDAASKPDRP